MKNLFTTALVGLSMSFASCTKSDDDTASSTSEETKTSEIKTANGVMAAIGDTLNSLGAAAPGTLVIAPSLRLDTHASANPLCSEHGSPLKPGSNIAKGANVPDSARLEENDPNYTANLFFCLSTLSAADGASVETVLGQIAQAQSILCSFEEAFGSFDYTTDGNDLVGSSPKAATLSSTCWPGGTPDGLEVITFTKGLATALDASTGYQKELAFTGTYTMGDETGEVNEKLQFFNKDGIIGFKKISDGNAPAVGGYSEFVMNSNTGVILVNTVDDRGGAGGADSAYRRVVRLKVAGTLDASLKFTGLDALQGIYANSGPDMAEYTIATLLGNKDDGFYGYFGNSFGSYTEVYKGCSGANTSCATADLKGLEATAAKVDTFYNSRSTWATQLASGLPPCDDGKDLSFAAVPTTGAFGVCE